VKQIEDIQEEAAAEELRQENAALAEEAPAEDASGATVEPPKTELETIAEEGDKQKSEVAKLMEIAQQQQNQYDNLMAARAEIIRGYKERELKKLQDDHEAEVQEAPALEDATETNPLMAFEKNTNAIVRTVTFGILGAPDKDVAADKNKPIGAGVEPSDGAGHAVGHTSSGLQRTTTAHGTEVFSRLGSVEIDQRRLEMEEAKAADKKRKAKMQEDLAAQAEQGDSDATKAEAEDHKDVHEGEDDFSSKDPFGRPEWMNGRCVLHHHGNLEDHITDQPFHSFQLQYASGSNSKQQSSLCGHVRGKIQISKYAQEGNNIDQLVKQVSVPIKLVVRVYIPKCFGVIRSRFKEQNCYLELTLNDHVHKCPAEKGKAVFEFLHSFETHLVLPGPAIAKLTLKESHLLGRDQEIGTTAIDLEDRWYSQQWNDIGLKVKPMEKRRFTKDTIAHACGFVNLWVDIMTEAEAAANPLINLKPPPPEPYELRCVVWKTKGVRTDTHSFVAQATDMNDLFCRGQVECHGTQLKRLESDTHWRAMYSQAEFNWRMLWKVSVPCKYMRLTFQAWDNNLYKWNMALATCTLDLARLQREAIMKKNRTEGTLFDKAKHTLPSENWDVSEGLFYDMLHGCEERFMSCYNRMRHGTDGTDTDDQEKLDAQLGKVWIPMRFNEDRVASDGGIQVSIELVPGEMAENQPVGQGRGEPNMNPHLDKPTTRFDFGCMSMMKNPCQWLYQCLGPKLICQLICSILFAVLIYFILIWWPTFVTAR